MYKLSKSLGGNRKAYVHPSLLKERSSKSGHSTEKRSAIAAVFAVAILAAGFVNNGTVKADDIPVEQVYGTIYEDETWTNDTIYLINGSVTIADSATLTIEPGTIVKVTSGWASTGINVDSGGTLDAEGTSTNPIVFTSASDDSAGGDTNSDGVSSGSNGDYEAAVSVPSYGGGETINVAFADIRFGTRSVNANCYSSSGMNSVTIVDSLIASQVNLAGCGNVAINMQRNQFNLPNGSSLEAIQADGVDPSGIVLAGVNKNVFTGTDKARVVYVAGGPGTSGVGVDTTKTWDIDGSSGAVVVARRLEVLGSVNLGAGAIIKNASTNYGINGNSIIVKGAGNLTVEGTSTMPAIFTTYSDDSIGGDSNGDGSSTGDATSSSASIYVEGSVDNLTATVSVAHADFKYGDYSIRIICNTLNDVQASVEDSVIRSGMVVSYCDGGEVALLRNQFQLPSTSQSLALDYTGSPTGVVLSGVNSNTFAGTGKARVMSVSSNGDDVVPAGTSWTVAGLSGVVLNARNIHVAGTLNLEAGVIIKPSSNNHVVTVEDDGILNINGTQTAPVTITSEKDDSVGGDTNTDGGASAPTIGDLLRAVRAEEGSEVNADHLNVRYASIPLYATGADSTISNSHFSQDFQFVAIEGGYANFASVTVDNITYETALSVSNDAQVTFRGSFDNLTGKAIQSCRWNTTCQVDAAYTDWGSSTGPLNSINPANGSVCGAVSISPWKHGGVEHFEDDAHAVPNCDGTSTPSTTISGGASYFGQRVGAKNAACSLGDQAACQAAATAYACLSSAMDLAQSTAPWPLPDSDTSSQMDALGGVIRENVAGYMEANTDLAPIGRNLSHFNALLDATSTILNIAQAYNNCAP